MSRDLLGWPAEIGLVPLLEILAGYEPGGPDDDGCYWLACRRCGLAPSAIVGVWRPETVVLGLDQMVSAALGHERREHG